MTKPTFIIELEAQPDRTDPHGHRRLRIALKRLLRGVGLRCKRAEQVGGVAATDALSVAVANDQGENQSGGELVTSAVTQPGEQRL